MNENIKNQILEWSLNHFGNDFIFRENQLETIIKIIDDKINNNVCHHIIQAPTGSGKSLINLITAGVLWTYYNKKSYILCSDLFLYNQYIDFINKYNLEDFKYLKGATGNYLCKNGNCDARNSPCKMAKISYQKLFNLYDGSYKYLYDSNSKDYKDYEKLLKLFPCITTCDYISERIEAVNAPITLMTYHLFYFQMNICDNKYNTHGVPIIGQFMYRDYIFCDECHNIPIIMQSRCRPNIKYNDLKDLIFIYNYYKNIKKTENKLIKKIDVTEINKLFNKYWTQMCDPKLTSYENTILLLNYTRKIVNSIYICAERIQNILGTKVKKGFTLNQKEKEIYSKITWVQNYHCYLDDFCRAIELSGFHYTYKQINKGQVNFGTVKEDGIIFYFLLRYGLCGTTLLSATVGNIESFKENCGYKFFENNNDYLNISSHDKNITNDKICFINIPSTFDFTYSPIYLDFEYKLNFKNKETSIFPLSQKINMILNHHLNENGLIQTGSYEIANKLYDLIDKENKKRILIYKNVNEKKKYISLINKHTNYVIIGPSLNEGIDLPKELCTFIIIAKVPFLSLADKYVSSKMKIFKKWYNDTAANNIIQGIGRGNRCKDDFCSIYIIDGCFKRLFSYTKKYFPNFITQRFIYDKIENIIKHSYNEAL